VSSYLPDLYIGDFLERLHSLPVRPCSIVMQEGHDVAGELLEVTGMIEQEKYQEE